MVTDGEIVRLLLVIADAMPSAGAGVVREAARRIAVGPSMLAETCPWCGDALVHPPRGRRRRWCKDACRIAAYRSRRNRDEMRS